jgi:CPA1 family monovalent cation:H+ antiporter
MDFLQITSILIVLAAAFGAINYLFFKLPSAIGILVVSLLASLGIVVIDALLPDMGIEDTVRTTVTGVDFSQALLEGMLGLLLFAGALHVKLSDLQKQWSLILLMATLGVALSTLVFGIGAHLMFGLPLLVALVFGSLISPTYPVAVLGVLRAANL